MSVELGRLCLAASLALAPALAAAQDRAVPRDGAHRRGFAQRRSDAGARHPSADSSSTARPQLRRQLLVLGRLERLERFGPRVVDAQRRHPRPGTGTGVAAATIPATRAIRLLPGLGRLLPRLRRATGGRTAFYGGYYGGYWAAIPYGGGAYYSYAYDDRGSLRILVDEPTPASTWTATTPASSTTSTASSSGSTSLRAGTRSRSSSRATRPTAFKVYVASGATLKIHHDMVKGTAETVEDLAGDAEDRYARRDEAAPRALRPATIADVATAPRTARRLGRRARPTARRPGTAALCTCCRRTRRSTWTARSRGSPARPAPLELRGRPAPDRGRASRLPHRRARRRGRAGRPTRAAGSRSRSTLQRPRDLGALPPPAAASAERRAG